MPEDPTDHRQYICGCRIVSCVRAHEPWHRQQGCDGAVRDPNRDRCWYLNSDGICNRDRMEHEGA